MISKLQWYNYDKQTIVVQSQGHYSSTITTDKLLWYNYNKPYFYIFRGEGKEHKGGQKRTDRDEKRKNK